MPLIDSQEQAIANGLVGDPAYTSPSTVYVGLSTTTPTATGSNFTEPSTGSYARVETDDDDWAAASGTAPAEKSNAAALLFPQATASWGTATHVGLFTASSGGTPYAWAALSSSVAVASGDQVQFAIGALKIQVGRPSDFA